MKKTLLILLVLVLVFGLSIAETESIMYTDIETGVSFSIPQDWTETEFDEEREFLDAKFFPNEDTGYTIMYSSVDLWKALVEQGVTNFSRAELSNSGMTAEVYAALFGASKLDRVIYGDYEYFKVISTEKRLLLGVEVEVFVTTLIHLDNGYFYSFVLYGTEENLLLYKDFESLLLSVKY